MVSEDVGGSSGFVLVMVRKLDQRMEGPIGAGGLTDTRVLLGTALVPCLV